MAVYRGGPTPSFYEFPCKYRLTGGNPSQTVFATAQTEISIPRFQRGIEWDEEKCQRLVNSKAQLFGTAILANDPNNLQKFILLDGLQRFATATAILVSLYNPIVSDSPTKPKAVVELFISLIAATRGYHDVYAYNHNVLCNFSRKIIQRSYINLYKQIQEYIESELDTNADEFAGKVCDMFLQKQIAIDVYSGFISASTINTTFRALNSENEPLTSADFIRSDLVERATSLNWSNSDIDVMEDLFSELFDDKDSAKLVSPLAELIEDNLASVFPSWNQLFSFKDFEKFYKFVNNSITNLKRGNSGYKFPYLYEIAQCGGVPFSYVVLYYYLEYVSSKSRGLPDFAKSSKTSISFLTSSELHILLRSIYRRVLDGSLGKLDNVGQNILKRRITSVENLADGFNPASAGSLKASANLDWLRQALRRANLTRSKRVFNACLLPSRNNCVINFEPLHYARGAKNWSIDHLIPKSTVKNSPGSGYYEGDTICNFAPCLGRDNSALKTNACSWKLSNANSPYLLNEYAHPFHIWLRAEHYSYSWSSQASLDEPAMLEANARDPVGDERINYICKLLQERL